MDVPELYGLLSAADNLKLQDCCDHCGMIFDGHGIAYVAQMVSPEMADPAFISEKRHANKRLIVGAVNALPGLLAQLIEMESLLLRENENWGRQANLGPIASRKSRQRIEAMIAGVKGLPVPVQEAEAAEPDAPSTQQGEPSESN